jgi:hypothetical protein
MERGRGRDGNWVNNGKADRRKSGQRRRKGRHNRKDDINSWVREIGCGGRGEGVKAGAKNRAPAGFKWRERRG